MCHDKTASHPFTLNHECMKVHKTRTESNSKNLVDERLDMMAMCTCSPESQLCPGLNQRQCGQKGQGGDSAPLLCSGESPPAVLHPALGSQHRKDLDLLEHFQRRDTKMFRGMENLSCKEKCRELGLFTPEKDDFGDLTAAFQYLKGPSKEDGGDFWQEHVVTRKGRMDSN
ncbi:hypothetical protein TURU_082827 [Turdus rufiventris]|nr:hypothetical protein TURU_082827 [Turdus rufiventris]